MNLGQYIEFMGGLDTAFFNGCNNDRYFWYTGTKYPDLRGKILQGFEINYIGVGAGFAASGVDVTIAYAGVVAWNVLGNKTMPSHWPEKGKLYGTGAGYNAELNRENAVLDALLNAFGN